MIGDNESLGWMADRDIGPLFRAMADRSLSLNILIQNPDELPAAIELIEHHQDLTIIIDHFAKPRVGRREFDDWATNVRRAAKWPHVTCKFSGLLNQAGPHWTLADLKPYAAQVLDCFGPARLMWGSDWPPLRLAAEYGRWWEVSNELLQSLSATDRASVFGATAQQLYRLA